MKQGDDALMHERLRALFQVDAEGLIACRNDWRRNPASRFHLGRTPQGHSCLLSADVMPDVRAEIQKLVSLEPLDCDVTPKFESEYLSLLGASSDDVSYGPAYVLESDALAATAAIRVNKSNAAVLERYLSDWSADVPWEQPMMVMLEGQDAVAICASVRITDQYHEAGVETHPDFRQRGFARDCVAAWTVAVAAMGATPCYSTQHDNAASQRLAISVGYRQYGSDFGIN